MYFRIVLKLYFVKVVVMVSRKTKANRRKLQPIKEEMTLMDDASTTQMPQPVSDAAWGQKGQKSAKKNK